MKNLILISFLFSFHLFSKTFLDETFNLIRHPKVDDIIWGFEFIDNNSILINTKAGLIHLFNIKEKKFKKLFTVPNVYSSGQGGLLDIKKSPEFENNKKIYLTFSKDIDGDGATTLASLEYDSKKQTIENFKLIKTFEAKTSTGRHFGSRIAINPAEKALFVSIGDRGERKNGQNTLTHAATILKLDYDGKPHPSNPFLRNKKFLPEIYSYGHRNPQGIFFLSEKQELWSTEHGPRGGDELNKIEAGKNYGWPVVSFGKEYWGPLQVGEVTHGRKGMQDSVYQYTPSIAPSSLMIYQGSKFPKWKNLFFISALKHKHINVLKFDAKNPKGKEFKLVSDLKQRIRHVAESPDGDIWFSTDSGRLFQITK